MPRILSLKSLLAAPSLCRDVGRFLRERLGQRLAWRSEHVEVASSARIDSLAQVNLPAIIGKMVVLSIGQKVELGPYVRLYPGPTRGISIGSFATINSSTDIHGEVSIGRHCVLAAHIYMSSGTHEFRLRPTFTIRDQDQLAA